jgi:nucleotide-binding universal stress UspA family protein
MASIVLCTDGSELAGRALAAGLAVLAPADRYVLATAVEGPDAGELVGASGLAGPTMSEEEFAEAQAEAQVTGTSIVDDEARRLGIPTAERRVVEGPPGEALCALAEEVGASAIVLGSRGRGGIKRALLGSVSDHVVRHAPCPVVVSHHAG